MRIDTTHLFLGNSWQQTVSDLERDVLRENGFLISLCCIVLFGSTLFMTECFGNNSKNKGRRDKKSFAHETTKFNLVYYSRCILPMD